MIRSLSPLALLIASLPAMSAEPDPISVEKRIAETLAAWDVPGAAVVVVRGDETLLLKGFGQREIGQPAKVTPDTIFPLASCSKAFTTTLLALLADDGVLQWDDPLAKHLPGFRLADPNANALLTVRDLLCHRCGIGGHDLLWYRAPWNLDETLKRAQRLPLDYPFRAGFQYSSIPFIAAGRAIEKRTGEKWAKLVKTRVCEPLGMEGVTFSTTEIPRDADRASGHKLGSDGKVERVPWYEIREPNPAGSVNATARDLAAWLKFHLSEGIDPNGTRLASVKNLAETKMPHNSVRLEGLAKELNPDTVQLSHALGWLVYDHRGKKVISHGGMIDGFRVQITMLPGENLGLAVLANLQETRMNAALTNTLIDLYCALPPRNWNAYFRRVVDKEIANRKATKEARDLARNAEQKPTLPLEDFTGTYTHPAYGTATVRVKNEQLVLVWGNFTCTLEHFEQDTFRATDGFFADQLIPFSVVDRKIASVAFAGQKFERK